MALEYCGSHSYYASFPSLSEANKAETRAASKGKPASSPKSLKTVATEESSEVVSHASDTSYWGRIFQREMQLSSASGTPYQVGNSQVDAAQLEKAVQELARRLQQENPEPEPWVLVTTVKSGFPDRAMEDGLALKPFYIIDETQKLFITKLGGHPHQFIVGEVNSELNSFEAAYDDLLWPSFDAPFDFQGNLVRPDVVLNWMHPAASANSAEPLRAPLIVEVFSIGKTVSGTLKLLSDYLQAPSAVYVMYVRIYKKHDSSGKFVAVAALWRKNIPDSDEEARLVEAWSFGTKPLHSKARMFLASDHGDLPAIAVDYPYKDHTTPVVIPAAVLLSGGADRAGNDLTTDRITEMIDDSGKDAVVFDLAKLRTMLDRLPMSYWHNVIDKEDDDE